MMFRNYSVIMTSFGTLLWCCVYAPGLFTLDFLLPRKATQTYTCNVLLPRKATQTYTCNVLLPRKATQTYTCNVPKKCWAFVQCSWNSSKKKFPKIFQCTAFTWFPSRIPTKPKKNKIFNGNFQLTFIIPLLFACWVLHQYIPVIYL